MASYKPVTRAVKVKLVVPRGKHDDGSSRSLWTTHDQVNRAVRHYQNILLLIRQEAFEPRDGDPVSKEEVSKRLCKLLNSVWDQNNVPANERKLDKALEVLRSLYEIIHRENAQTANALLSPLSDPKSVAFVELTSTISKLPNWIDAPVDECREIAASWLANGSHEKLKPATGAPPAWYKRAIAADDSWLPLLQKWAEEKKTEMEFGQAGAINAIRKLNLIPLFEPYFAPKMKKSGVTGWDRLAWRLAVAQLSSWETWSVEVLRNYEDRKSKVKENVDKFGDDNAQSIFNLLRKYETDRSIELDQQGPALGDKPAEVKISRRTIRSWNKIKEQWFAAGSRDEQSLVDILSELQTKMRGKFGDPHLFRWLAKPENQLIWAKDKRDLLKGYAIINDSEALLERSKEQATLTFADALASPRTAQWEYKGGANLKNWSLHQTENGLSVNFSGLVQNTDGSLSEQDLEFNLAKTKQFKIDEIFEIKKKKYGLKYTAAGEQMTAALGSADLLLNWQWLRTKRSEEVAEGKIGAAYLKIALNVDPVIDERIANIEPGAHFHFLTAKGQKSNHAGKVKDGYRVLSVDLGLRHFASCSVFALKDAEPKPNQLAYYAEDLQMWAHHERSFTLKLQGESKDKHVLAWQEQETRELNALRRSLNRYRRLRSLDLTNPTTFDEELSELADEAFKTGHPFEVSLIQELRKSVGVPLPVLKDQHAQTLQQWRWEFGQLVSDWRRARTTKDMRKHYGKTAWAIQHLEDTRRFLKSWSLIGQEAGEVNRWDNDASGIFARRLADHIAGMKDDRIKSGADQLVQAARGYQQTETGSWLASFAPCHLILFEDLTRYRMKLDRPKRENSLLAQWSHRSMVHEVTMQAALFGINVGDIEASFSSRMAASDGTPGHRVSPVTKAQLADQRSREWIERANPGIQWSNLKPGSLVLDAGGSFLATLQHNKLKISHADINAAQSLQKRFWTRFGNQQILRSMQKVVQDDGTSLWVPRRLGKRVVGTMQGHGYLKQVNNVSGASEWVNCTARAYNLLAGDSTSINDDITDASDELEAALAELNEVSRTEEVTNFFRDESGALLNAEYWYPSKVYWGNVKARILSELKSQWA